MADKKALLTVDGIDKTIELPVLSGTLGTDVIDVRGLGANGVFTLCLPALVNPLLPI